MIHAREGRAIVAAVLLGLVPGWPVAAIADPVTEDPSSAVDPDFAAGRAAIDARDWPAAIRALSSAALRDTRNADIQNYLGYAYRHTGQMNRAFEHYERALSVDIRDTPAPDYAMEPEVRKLKFLLESMV